MFAAPPRSAASMSRNSSTQARRRRSCARPSRVTAALDELVGRDRDGHLARLGIDELASEVQWPRSRRAEDDPDHNENSEQARHGMVSAGRPRSTEADYDHFCRAGARRNFGRGDARCRLRHFKRIGILTTETARRRPAAARPSPRRHAAARSAAPARGRARRPCARRRAGRTARTRARARASGMPAPASMTSKHGAVRRRVAVRRVTGGVPWRCGIVEQIADQAPQQPRDRRGARSARRRACSRRNGRIPPRRAPSRSTALLVGGAAAMSSRLASRISSIRSSSSAMSRCELGLRLGRRASARRARGRGGCATAACAARARRWRAAAGGRRPAPRSARRRG